jgi:L-rhamnonate dehydratase
MPDGSPFGLDVLGTLVVEVETAAGDVGVGVSTGGVPACFVVERHLARLVEGADPSDLETIWDRMWRATMFYGRRGLVLHAISAVDLALWDLLGRLRDEPVHALLGGAARDEIELYATGPRPDLAKELGFVGGKMSLGADGLRQNLATAEEMRGRVGDDFVLAYDCWMALDVPDALSLIEGLAPYRFRWVEECLPPDDYWGYAELRRRAPRDVLITTGEHEATRFGFRLLVDMGCCDVVQPDVAWCGGLTELLRIAAYADAHGVLVVPHASSVYSYHFVATRRATPFAEFVMMSPDGGSIVPTYGTLLEGEPLPAGGRIPVAALDRPGFGVELNRSLDLARPFPR